MCDDTGVELIKVTKKKSNRDTITLKSAKASNALYNDNKIIVCCYIKWWCAASILQRIKVIDMILKNFEQHIILTNYIWEDNLFKESNNIMAHLSFTLDSLNCITYV